MGRRPHLHRASAPTTGGIERGVSTSEKWACGPMASAALDGEATPRDADRDRFPLPLLGRHSASGPSLTAAADSRLERRAHPRGRRNRRQDPRQHLVGAEHRGLPSRLARRPARTRRSAPVRARIRGPVSARRPRRRTADARSRKTRSPDPARVASTSLVAGL